MTTIIIFLILFIIFLIYFISLNNKSSTNTNNIKDHDTLDYNLINYKISNNNNNHNKKEIDLSNKYNIKSYDVINDNILIHNKYKKELISNKYIKQKKDLLKLIELKKKNKQIIDNINENAVNVIIDDINNNNIKLNNEINSLKLLLKRDFNDCLNDLKNNKIQKKNIVKLIKIIQIDINNIKKSNNDIIKLANKYNNNNKIISLLKNQKKLYKVKNKLCKIKLKFYNKILIKIN